MFSKQYTFPARYWDDPHTFKPSRFLEDWPRDAFTPFSVGENFFFFHFSKSASFLIIKICRSPCVPWTKVCGFYCPLQPKFFYTISSFYLLRFAETEEIAVLAMLVSQYKFKIKEERARRLKKGNQEFCLYLNI